ncbi:MAG: EAL domain-containing protein [Alphaproteobacteria bacterium]|nr:MAG: EAL domain-containing protein [Alphaproteobacteria bacterium]
MTINPLAEFLSAGDAVATPQGRSQIDAILNAVRHHLGMEIAFASRFVGDRREFTHIVADIPLPLGPGDSEPLEDTFCHHILEGRLPALIHNAADHPLAMTLPIAPALPVGAHVNVPLMLKDGSVYGTFCCLSRTSDYSLNERDLSTLRAFADLAVEQIQLQRDTETIRALLVEKVTGAIAGNQPMIVLQPIHRLDTGRSAGCEALARFADAGSRPPSDWFAEAFEVGMGVALEIAAVEKALAALPYVPADHYVSINVSPEAVLSGRVGPLLEAVKRPGIVLEVTEHARVDDYAALRDALAALRPYARIAIDDVGAGYSSLRHIIALAPDILKLDMSLTRDVDRDPARRALAGAMVNFASRIGASIVAEGIERVEEAQVLRDLGITYGQGYLFSRPMPLVAAQQHMLGLADPVTAVSQPDRKQLRAA